MLRKKKKKRVLLRLVILEIKELGKGSGFNFNSVFSTILITLPLTHEAESINVPLTPLLITLRKQVEKAGWGFPWQSSG